VATRSSGMQSDKYSDIADITRGLRAVIPGKVLVVRPLPHTSTGPSVREMILGSEGRLGVITEVTVQVHRIPEAADLGISVPVLGRRAGRHARDLDQRRPPIDHPGLGCAGDQLLLRHSQEVDWNTDFVAGEQGLDEGAGEKGMGPRAGLPVLHRL
jgi:FAD/FMN-containing dehydrogenase